ncbi:uncharacterized protein CLUP02_10822 [Colletotrichum lupini]|uniref:Uncharacterized protein n=1 Tax=Colletotrichum lupini TaxID=145971 RepID=A0A9Q8WJX6_9PEZI|nr:uncharacterized protein CLUP02_10822 [Colletotrichum lupini]UQC85325.1 hypothetical protein CLUP02_10822 [Colletotrichum lupini]
MGNSIWVIAGSTCVVSRLLPSLPTSAQRGATYVVCMPRQGFIRPKPFKPMLRIVLNLPGQFTLSKRSSELWPAQERLIQCHLHLKPKGLCVRVSQPTHVHTNGRVQPTIIRTGTGYMLGGTLCSASLSPLMIVSLSAFPVSLQGGPQPPMYMVISFSHSFLQQHPDSHSMLVPLGLWVMAVTVSTPLAAALNLDPWPSELFPHFIALSREA